MESKSGSEHKSFGRIRAHLAPMYNVSNYQSLKKTNRNLECQRSYTRLQTDAQGVSNEVANLASFLKYISRDGD